MKQKRTSKKKVSSTNVAVASAEQLKSVITVADAEKENREHKDSVFVDLFYEDETAEENLLSLYNALHDTNYQNVKNIHKIRVENVLYKNFKNDISFEVDQKVIVFGEHQSTVNKNMPLRCLMYAGRAYEQLVDSEDRYRTALVKIPAPEFYTFYNGIAEFPLEQELFLSDAYLDSNGKASLEEYSLFIDTVRKYSKEEDSIKKAIHECMERGILADYLRRKVSEVMNMLIAEYSYEKDIQVKQEEAFQVGERIGETRGEKRGKKTGKRIGKRIGKKIGKQEGIILSSKVFQAVKENPDFTNKQIASKVACTVENVEDVRKMFSI